MANVASGNLWCYWGLGSGLVMNQLGAQSGMLVSSTYQIAVPYTILAKFLILEAANGSFLFLRRKNQFGLDVRLLEGRQKKPESNGLEQSKDRHP